MKFTNIFYLAFAALLITSCSSEISTSEENLTKDFSGIYDGIIDCTDGFEHETGEETTIIIIKDLGDSYKIHMEDDLILDAELTEDETLRIPSQEIGEGQSFDNFIVEGELREIAGNFTFSVRITSDTDENGECSFEVLKR